MGKSILGVDIGYDSLKLALVKDGKVKKAATVPMPKSLVRDGRVVSPESMGELLRTTMKQNGIHCGRAALVLANETVFVRSVVMPRMTVEQLKYNLPFEFRDYITDELKNYIFDYGMVTTREELLSPADRDGDGSVGNAMELMAVAAPVSLIEEGRSFLRKAGLKLVKASPTVSCYQSLIRMKSGKSGSDTEYCILDLGYRAIRMYMFRGERHVATRELETGLSFLIRAIADAAGIDEHLAHTYLLENFEDWQNNTVCRSVYDSISVELMRALNFYRFSNPESEMNDLYLAGGGAMIRPLCETIANTVGMPVRSIEELVPGGTGVEACHSLAQAIGVTLN